MVRAAGSARRRKFSFGARRNSSQHPSSALVPVSSVSHVARRPACRQFVWGKLWERRQHAPCVQTAGKRTGIVLDRGSGSRFGGKALASFVSRYRCRIAEAWERGCHELSAGVPDHLMGLTMPLPPTPPGRASFPALTLTHSFYLPGKVSSCQPSGQWRVDRQSSVLASLVRAKGRQRSAHPSACEVLLVLRP